MKEEKIETETGGRMENGSLMKKTGSTVLVLLESLLLMTVGTVIGSSLYLLPRIFPSLSSSDVWSTGVEYALSWGIWPVVILASAFIPHDRICLPHIGRTAEGNTPAFFALGLLSGFAMNALCASLALLTGKIDLSFDSFSPLSLLLLLIAVLFQSGSEELVCRVFVLRRLEKVYSSTLPAVIVNSLFFALLHIFNDGISVTGIIENFAFGILMSLIVCYYDSFWSAAALHTAWNFTQNIIFGLPNSGVLVPYSVFRLDSASSSMSFFYDPGFGIEGSLLSCIVVSAAAVLVFIFGRRRVRGSAPSEEGQ